MHKWIVVMLVVGFVGVAAKAEDKAASHTAAPSIEKKDEVKQVEDKTTKLFSLISACMVNTPAATADANVAVK